MVFPQRKGFKERIWGLKGKDKVKVFCGSENENAQEPKKVGNEGVF